jgi:alpha-ketoglutarate-dependent taurine dioxygenase
VPLRHVNAAAFGAEIHGINLNSFSDADFDLISDALHRHKLLVFKGQPEMLTPQQQYRLTSKYTPPT